MPNPPFVGRSAERARLSGALAARGGDGTVVLVAGDAGVGKTRLINEVASGWPGIVLRGTARPGGDPYGPIVEVLHTVRTALGSAPSGAAATLTEGTPPVSPRVDIARLAASIADTLRAVAVHEPTVIILEDLHWSDAATLDLIPPLAGAVLDVALTVVATYRNSELPRAHPLRRVRTDLRRAALLTEISLDPFALDDTAELLTGLLGAQPSDALAAAVHTRTDGVAFYITELASALTTSGGQRSQGGVVELATETELPLPESVVDAVTVCTADLQRRHPDAVQLATVLGVRVDLPTLADLTATEATDDLLDSGLLAECGDDAAEFRHALVRDALYQTIPWSRRRALHRKVAAHLAEHDARPEVVAEHWIAAHEPELARPLLLAAARQRCTVHAYRDAAVFGRRAIAIWPPDAESEGRIDALAQLAECAELSGELDVAASVWTEVAELGADARDVASAAAAQRRLANVAELLGDWPRATAAREAAADLFATADLPADAAMERLALAEHLTSAARHTDALEHAVAATEYADTAGRVDLKAHALAVQGSVRVHLGEDSAGVALARAGLELAITERLAEAAGASYYELATALLHAADYTASVDAYDSAAELCQAHGVTDLETACVACMSVAARLLGDWDHALAISSEVLDDPRAPEMIRMVAEEETGLIRALRGDYRRARGPLRRAAAFGRDAEVFGIEVGALWGRAVLDTAHDDAAGARRVSALLRRCEQKEISIFALPPLRWAATFLAEQGLVDSLALCHRVLAAFATQNSSPKVLSALAHAGGELAMVNGEAAQAGAQFSRALELLPATTAPWESALTRLRHGAALARQSERDAAVESITSSYHLARRLEASPLAHRCATALAGMGEQVDRRLGRLAARALEPAGLTRREKEVLRQVATGHTNRQIADELFLSTRTVDMHVRNLLTKLDCPSRTAAVRRATELGLVPEAVG